MKKLLIFIVILEILFNFCANANQDLEQLRAGIQISSKITEGVFSLSDIARAARESNIDVVIFTERDFMEWTYGVWPLRNVIKKTIRNNSLSRYGFKRYLDNLGNLRQEFQDIIFIPGIESAPFYYWEGSIFKDNLKMNNWHKHLLVFGLDNVKDYMNLPVIANQRSLKKGFRPYKLWPIFLITVGLLCFKKRKYDYRDELGRGLGPFSKRWRAIGLIFIIAGVLFLINNYPFCKILYDQYQGDLGVFPHQNFINYVNSKGGLVFWAHPEAEYIQTLRNVKFETKNHTDDLRQTQDYTGFCIFYEGYKQVGRREGLWDEILKSYCRGERKRPVWAIGGLAFEDGTLLDCLKALQTVILVPRKEEASVLSALKDGRMYVIRGSDSSGFVLDEFSISGGSVNSEKKFSGDTINLEGQALICIKGHFLDGRERELSISLIREGKIIENFNIVTPFNIQFSDKEINNRKTYYRLELGARGIHLITNPIFVVKK